MQQPELTLGGAHVADADQALCVRDLHGHYGPSHVLHGMAFDVPSGQVVTLLGRNGAGKTTTMRALIGLLTQRTGSVRVNGHETIGLPPEKIAPLGLAYCPEERGIFASLSVQENLMLPPVLSPGGLSSQEVLALFPRLGERANSPGTKLSGGEQQMLAIARILRTGARVLLLDEPTEGLAPVIVEHIGEVLENLKQRGYTILLVEQNLDFAMSVADRHYVVEHGRVVDAFSNDSLLADPDQLQAYLGV
ncbi:ABC transporter ATP-binding protein [Ottowia thiooxydans]|uniref:ABC transporter ATP-binding protein n=1 Tax=Ottowia thiooxydans TaxID=219182 RepID=UPI00041BAF5F|nr:ABC transporter ATP-binding protein [Ottowia thiooxydans]